LYRRHLVPEQIGQPARGDNERLRPHFRGYATQKPFDHPGIAPVKARLHRRYRIRPNHGRGLFDIHSGQFRGGHVQGLHRQIRSRSDGSAAIGPGRVDHVERGRRAEIHDDGRGLAVQHDRRRVRQTVRADGRGVRQFDFKPRRLMRNDERHAAKRLPAQPVQMKIRVRHDGTQGRAAHLPEIQPVLPEKLEQPRGVFVRRPLAVGPAPPDAALRFALVQGEDDVGVSGVDDEQHVSRRPLHGCAPFRSL